MEAEVVVCQNFQLDNEQFQWLQFAITAESLNSQIL